MCTDTNVLLIAKAYVTNAQVCQGLQRTTRAINAGAPRLQGIATDDRVRMARQPWKITAEALSCELSS